ncbi:MAG: dipeptidase PepE [Xanthomarina sp.]|uniref:dipeptidase PepE n=1 Tax=Xanthomarina sp. TaxID=1931211 RepID=UPI000C62BECD|nr:dipeptidase PepE [Xanthomarina sp.]MBF62589.1 dipeptidase PepE [Xanthomarina sp.]HAI18939.1 dipeptidase PepE [Xanthomarina gelatinilytica]
MKNLIIASTSTVHGSGYLEYLLDELALFFKDANTIVFIPYARPSGISHEDYTIKAREAFKKIHKNVMGIHEFENPIEAIQNAEAIFTGGGNTFVLLYQLYKNNLLEPLKKSVLKGTPYLGTSAGSNICGLTINTTNDMPIVYPPSFKALSFMPFNINPHYLDPIPNNKHMGETRETRIKEFHAYHTQPVIGLREGSWLQVTETSIKLKGPLTARVFEYNKTPYEIESGTELKDLR